MASADEIRRLISRSRTPLIFRGLIDQWPMKNFTQENWDDLFAGKLLECRVGVRNSMNNEPQWEGHSATVQCSYKQIIEWTGDELSGLNPGKHFLYFGYKYMKDVFDEKVLRMVDWNAFGYPGRTGAESTFWLGTPGAHTPCHYDTYGCNLVAQLVGKKRWILYPPEDMNLLEPTRVPYEESSVYSRINFEKWSDSVPDIKGSHPHVIELLPGDVLFVPRHWWHHVSNVELSISVNTWLELPEEDEHARLHESLVKFLVAHTSRNLSPEVIPELLNPNEEDMAYADLEEIQGFIRNSLRVMKDAKSEDGVNEIRLPLDQSWVCPVACCPVPGGEAGGKKSRTEPELDVLDIIRAFCHPRVIETVSQVLQGKLN